MPWSSEKQAGFALAAALCSDRELTYAGPLLTSEALDALRGTLSRASQVDTREGKEQTINSWLRVLRPPLCEEATRLPARMQGLLALSATMPLRARLLANAHPARADFSLDDGLSAALLRIARHCSVRAEQGARRPARTESP